MQDTTTAEALICKKNLLGPRIREARYRLGNKISQTELAARLQDLGVNVDPSAISRIENQERHLSDIELVAIAQVLGVPLANLLEG